MFDIFANPGYLAVAAGLVSAPIIIHLINRMRFKRIRWAAMEFLLKAQKRNRRRLIIEQLLLLALRCILVALVGLLVMRFVGFSFADFAAKQALHIVLLDDTLSMTDQAKEADRQTDAFQKAKKELWDKVVKKVSQVNSKDRLVVLPLSKIAGDSDFEPTTYERLFVDQNLKDLELELANLEPTKLHVSLLQGVKKTQEIVNNNIESRITLYVFSDFRQKDWSGQEGDALYKNLQSMVDSQKDMKLFLFDTAHPDRSHGQSLPLAHDNIGITELRAGTRVAGRAMPVHFTATITNYSGRDADVQLRIYDDATEQELPQVDFNPPMPVRVSAFSSLTVSFDLIFNPQIRPSEVFFARISARLKSAQLTELENDGLAADNIRHAAVEVREKVPILVIDGEGSKGRQESKDTFFIRTAIISVPGASYEVEYGDELGGGVAVKALERSDLHKYPTIFMLNVREVTGKQLTNLENYVREGGGVAFFMGPLASAKLYNKALYREGNGLFPAPLRETYFPAPNEEAMDPQYTGEPQLLLRDDLLGEGERYPIFGPIFKDPGQRDTLKDMRIKRYFQVPRADWHVEPGKVFEIATLPNSLAITVFNQAARDAVRGPRIEKILDNEELRKYRKGIERHARAVDSLVQPGSEKKAYHLADALDNLLRDKGKDKDEEHPNLTEFWSNSDPKIRTLKDEILKLRDQVRYGDPFIVARNFGKGRVAAVMSTAGKEWNDWAGGSQAALIFQPFIWELQNYLSSQGSEGNLTVGTPVQITIDPEQFKQKNRQLKMVRLRPKRPGEKDYPKEEQFGTDNQGQLSFNFPKNHEPGLYVSQLHHADGEAKLALLSIGHVFNVDTTREGPLQRLSFDEMKRNLIDGRDRSVTFLSGGSSTDSLVARQSDLSENPLLYLIFLAVLVAEQALAVHLSFHLRGSEGDVLTKLTKPARLAA
ncbi:MAG: BatA domain-containing protein [Gemmataceae bacterium]|nr:BatA domain-containing protein [Gemmataceae bacterium]